MPNFFLSYEPRQIFKWSINVFLEGHIFVQANDQEKIHKHSLSCSSHDLLSNLMSISSQPHAYLNKLEEHKYRSVWIPEWQHFNKPVILLMHDQNGNY